MGEGCCMLEMRANDQEWGRFRKKKVKNHGGWDGDLEEGVWHVEGKCN